MRFSSAVSLSRPTADIRTSIAPSSNLAIVLLPLFCTGHTRQNHLGAAKESFQLESLIGLERSHVVDGQLSEAIAQSVEPHPRRSVGDTELIGDFAKGNVTPDADHHRLLLTGQLA